MTAELQVPNSSVGRCNLCDGETFSAQGARSAVRCESCGSLERTRLAYLFMRSLQMLNRRSSVLHFAPERGLHAHFSQSSCYEYVACDYDPSRYPSGVRKVDLKRDLPTFASESVDLVIHNHVLEHIACNYGYVLAQLDRVLKPGGLHVFSVPIRKGYFAESLDPQLSRQERERLFLQHDHVRVFGSEDIQDTLGRLYDLPAEYDLTRWFNESELVACNIPRYCWKGYNGHSVLCLRKTQDGMRFAEPARMER
jgi:predicted SAM-dependent methyltransferase